MVDHTAAARNVTELKFEAKSLIRLMVFFEFDLLQQCDLPL